jgi:hypothetical protein
VTIGRWLWPVALLASSGGALAAYLWDPPGAVRAAMVAWFLLVCPGMALARLLRLPDLLAEWVLAIALSLGLATMAGAATLYAGRWEPGLALAALAALCVVGALLQLRLEVRAASADLEVR